MLIFSQILKIKINYQYFLFQPHLFYFLEHFIADVLLILFVKRMLIIYLV